MAGGYTRSHDAKAITVQIGATTAATADVYAFAIMPFDGEVIAVEQTNGATVAKHTANYTVFTLQNGGSSGTGTTAMATLSGAGTAGNVFAADVPSAYTLSTTTASRRFASGDMLKIDQAATGNGAATTAFAAVTVWVRAGYEHGDE